MKSHFSCKQCGAHVRADEDGCCGTCGNDCSVEDCSCSVERYEIGPTITIPLEALGIKPGPPGPTVTLTVTRIDRESGVVTMDEDGLT